MDSQSNSETFASISSRLLETLAKLQYGKDTITNYRRILRRTWEYMEQEDCSVYSESIGIQFLTEQFSRGPLSASYARALRCTIRRLNDECCRMQYVRRHPKSVEVPPSQWQAFLAGYLLCCKEKGNHENTLKIKYCFCTRFLNILSSQGIQNISSLNANMTVQACLQFTDKGAYAEVRQFLAYLYKMELIHTDLSQIIPHYVKPSKLPSVYSVDEIRKLECAVNQPSAAGLRNYAIVLLASRIGMRSGDIVRLRIGNLDFEHNRICFTQSKTGKEQELPMVPEVRAALESYLKTARPSGDSDIIFLNVVAPYTPISTSAIRGMLKNAFVSAGIDFCGRKHGAHSLRASLASSLVNDGVPYEAVRKILGHTDPRAIAHYAKVDLENLRLYALDAPPPSGNFRAYLYGRSAKNEHI